MFSAGLLRRSSGKDFDEFSLTHYREISGVLFRYRFL